MSQPTLTQIWPLRLANADFSLVDTSVLTSYLCFRHFEPQSTLPLLVLLVLIPAFLTIPISYHVQSPYLAPPLAFLAYGCLLILFILAYRLSPFHPLAKYPGPVLDKTSKWWAAYISARGDPHRYYKSLHDRYGDVVRVGPNELSIRDASLIHPVLGPGGLPKGPRWDGRPGLPALIEQRDPIQHMHQRKPWNRAFSSTALKEYESIVAKRIRQLVGCLEDRVHSSDQKEGAVLDMAQWMNYFTTDFMGDMAFGGGFELMKAGGDREGLWTLIESGLHVIAVLGHVSYLLPAYLSMMRGGDTIQRSRGLCREKALDRLRMDAKRKDLFYYLSGEDMPEAERPPIGNVAKDGTLAIIAGSDTTSSVLTALVYYLLCNPAAYHRLQEEVDAAFPSGEEPLDVVKLSHMEWLNGCINETLRLHPPVPSGSQRSLGRGKGTKVLGNLIIPEQTQLFLHTYSIQRDPRNFHNPEVFLPERWFSTDAPVGEHNTDAFFPFSYGPTICAGKNLALMEMRMLICWVLRRFRFSKTLGFSYETWDVTTEDWFVLHQHPMLASISRRE
ncbi:high nitrogen upregulated cytochrome P450 monooxygenase 2 [Multifurca ochricompacta]|uniref:High nitrogen upregulated cytochrome P450 monooxygenase 2 n=1 Tax=Multifurca ochricompacta TaxID=376703 RepID=A0AAD4QQN3_9AGAM|nr:high nitrogen upregulated cytochrome P450 monooxygenase 2 [Multifurca ochricompacta]